jgi:hypothetical protein
MENYKNTGNNNGQNDIKCLKCNKNITNNQQKIANTFNDYSSNLGDTVFGKIKKIRVILETM